MKNLILLFALIITLLSACNDDSKPAASITSISTTSGSVNTPVTITGTNFSSDANGNKVMFNGVKAVVNKATATELIVTVPTGSGTGPVTVTTDQGTTTGPSFTYVDVYVAGFETNGPIGNVIAKYWKNGTAVSLTDGSGYASAEAIIVTGTDVYVAGYEIQGINSFPRFWKNGTGVPIDILMHGRAYAITAAGSDIYIAGYYGKDAAYWKNGSVVLLTDGLHTGIATAITIVEGNIYVAGHESSGSSVAIATYWKNGKAFPLPGSQNSRATGITVVGNDVYVVGYEYNDSNSKSMRHWKNSEVIPLASGNITGQAEATDIVAVASDIYILGIVVPVNSNAIVRYWKNGNLYPVTNGSQQAAATAITVWGTDMYVSGSAYKSTTNNTNGIAMYWNNNTAIHLTDGSNNAGANSIFLVQ